MRALETALLALALIGGSSACGTIETAPLDRDAARAMLAQGLAALGAVGTVVVSAELGAEAPAGVSVAEALGALEARTQELLPCAVVFQELPLSQLSLQFEGAGAGCLYAGAGLGGELQVRIPPRSEEDWTVALLYEGFSAGVHGVDGRVDIERTEVVGRLALLLDTRWRHEASSIIGAGRVELLRGGDPSVQEGRVLELDISWFEEDRRWELVSSDIGVRPGAAAPSAGSIGMADPVGRVATIEFENLPTGGSRAFFSGIREPWSFEVTPEGEIL